MERKDYETTLGFEDIYRNLPIEKTVPMIGDVDLTVTSRHGNKATVVTREPDNKYLKTIYTKRGKHVPQDITETKAQELINQSQRKK